MAIPFSKMMIQEHTVNPVYEAFKKAGVKFTQTIPLEHSLGAEIQKVLGSIDLTEAVAKELAEAGFSAEFEEKQSEPMQECSANRETYVFPAGYTIKVADALGVDISLFDDLPKKITISCDGKLSTVQVER